MISIGKLGAGQEAYYTEKVAEGAEDYYSGEGEAEGQWIGDAAAELGLSGDVHPAQLPAMLTGNNPATGEPLGLRPVGGKGPVPGFDLTFSAPKSVSLTWALGGPEVAAKVQAAHERSIQAALGYMQRHACWTRRGAGGAEFVQGNGYLAAAYRHRSSRNGDPQLHTHVLVANATKGPDGKWSRLYHPAIYEHAKTAGYLYEAQLRHELSRTLGVQWQEVRRGIAEIEGFRDEWLRAFSTRRAEILEAAGPGASAKARQVATLTTRHAKDREIEPEGLRERWTERAAEIGLTREGIAATQGRAVEPKASLTLDALDHAVTAHAAHFDRREAIQAVADLLPSGAPAKEVEATADAFLASEFVIRVSEGAKGERFTTQRIWELERGALQSAEKMASEPRGFDGEVIAVRTIKDRPTLKPDQRRMVERLLAGREGIVVVIGEAAQLDAIEAGGLFSAIAERTDPVGLDEVIRHNYALDREAAKRIREGEGAQALSLYRSEERVTVAPDAEARREAMVADWLASYRAGDDALMVAQRNAEVERLNATAREALRAEGTLGEREVMAGGAPFAAGDQVITRVNDHANHIYNRERWQVAEVDPERRRIVLEGIDRDRTVEVGPEYLAQTTLGGEVSALQHAYAVTTYCAQGATVDRAYVMADPSMDRQEFYVATSRSREETYLYATAEHDSGREEFAPPSVEERGALGQLAQSAERDRSQSAAHDEAKRAELAKLPTPQLAERHRELERPADNEFRQERACAEKVKEVEHCRERLERAVAERETAEGLPRRERKVELPQARLSERWAEERLAEHSEALRGMEPPTDSARREHAIAERLLAERVEQALTAARIEPPKYVTKELGERPSDPTQAKAWDKGVRGIESYRQEHGVTDKKRALGKEPKEIGRQAARERAQRRLREAQRGLGRGQQLGRSRDTGRSLGIGR
jgi:conjugative relaxase-like TrwC/TraI family protein